MQVSTIDKGYWSALDNEPHRFHEERVAALMFTHSLTVDQAETLVFRIEVEISDGWTEGMSREELTKLLDDGTEIALNADHNVIRNLIAVTEEFA